MRQLLARLATGLGLLATPVGLAAQDQAGGQGLVVHAELRPTIDRRWATMSAPQRAGAGGYRIFLDRYLARCPSRQPGSGRDAYERRVRGSCEVHWRRLSSADATGSLLYGDFIARCARSCTASRSEVASQAGAGALGLAAAGAGILVGLESTRAALNDRPASP